MASERSRNRSEVVLTGKKLSLIHICADGHLDSYYASLFGRYQDRRWAHTLILTGGWNDAKLNRKMCIRDRRTICHYQPGRKLTDGFIL